MKYILLVIDNEDREERYGPFKNGEEALNWGEENFNSEKYFLMSVPLDSPTKKKQQTKQNPSTEQIRIQRLEKKLKKFKDRDKAQKEQLSFYKKLTKDFPLLQSYSEIYDKNKTYYKQIVNLERTIKEKDWIIKGLEFESESLKKDLIVKKTLLGEQ
jgi:hypothetical protein